MSRYLQRLAAQALGARPHIRPPPRPLFAYLPGHAEAAMDNASSPPEPSDAPSGPAIAADDRSDPEQVRVEAPPRPAAAENPRKPPHAESESKPAGRGRGQMREAIRAATRSITAAPMRDPVAHPDEPNGVIPDAEGRHVAAARRRGQAERAPRAAETRVDLGPAHVDAARSRPHGDTAETAAPPRRSELPPPPPQRARLAATAQRPPDVHIHIGRVELTAVAPPPAARREPSAAAPSGSLDAYLLRRGGRSS